MAEWHEVHVRTNVGGREVCAGDQQEWPCHTVQAFRYGQSLGEQTGRFGRRPLDARDPNILARKLADALDANAALQEELVDAAGVAGQWKRWAEEVGYVVEGVIKPTALEHYDYDRMLSEANVALEKVRDEAYERGEAEGLRTARSLLEHAITAYGEEHHLTVGF